MIATATDLPVAKSTRRPVRKASPRPVEPKIKVGLHLSSDAARRLGITATMEGKDRSQLVDELIREHLRKYVVLTRGERVAESVPVPGTGDDRQDMTAA